jgi:hypothetical protein
MNEEREHCVAKQIHGGFVAGERIAIAASTFAAVNVCRSSSACIKLSAILSRHFAPFGDGLEEGGAHLCVGIANRAARRLVVVWVVVFKLVSDHARNSSGSRVRRSTSMR